MNKYLFLVMICFIIIHTAQSQIQRKIYTNKTNLPLKEMPNKVPNSKIVIYQSAAKFTNPSKTLTLPDGRKITTTLRQNPQNLPKNLGGTVNETISNTSQQSTNDFNCTSEVKMITANSSTFMEVNYNQQAVHIYPGAIYTFDSFFSGNFRALEQGRNPITISTDNLANSTGAVYETVSVPTATNISTAIGNIIRPFSTTTGSSNIQYRVFTSDNDAELSIKLSAGGEYAGFTASGGYSPESKEKKYFLTIDAIKPMYTLTTSVPAEGFFSDKNIENANQNLIVLKSITYGTRVLANVEITLNTEKDALDFKANYGAKGVSASASFNYLKNTSSASSTANVYVVGGPLNTSIFETDKLQQQITELISRCNYQTAKPIAYSFSDINGNILGIESVTDKFTTKKCVPKGSVFKLKLAKVSIMTGNDTKEQGSNAIISLTNSNNMVVFENSNNNIEFKNSNDVVLNARALPTSYNDQFLETAFSTNGGYIDIFLEPKPVLFAWDDWQIRSVNVVFIFEDQYKAIQHRQFNFNASVYLKKDQQRVRLPFDGMFNAGGVFMPGL